MDEKQISELLECSVCLERFDQTCKVLPCQHTFCRRCLDEILLTKHELRCPECRALVTIRVADLPTNILVVRILEGLKTKGQRPLGGGVRLHGTSNQSSSPSKHGASSPHHRHDTAFVHQFRQPQGSQPCARALYNYDSQEKDDLPFKKGDIVMLRRQIDDNWYQGELSGRLGFFPANFVQVLVPLPQIPQCRALYDFDLKDEGEKDCLSFKKDEVLTVIRRVDENWLEGRKGDKIGIFPITFVELNDAARSLINTKSNLTILPSSSSTSSSVSVTSTTSMSTAGTTSVTSSNRNASNASGTITITATPSTSAGQSTSAIPAEEAPTESSSISQPPSSSPLPSSEMPAASDSSTPSESPPTSSSSSASSTLAEPGAATSASIPEVLPQNKRHSYTSASLSSPTTTAANGHTQQRHSAEVTLTACGTLTLVSSDTDTVTTSASVSSSSTSVPSSTTCADSQGTMSSSPQNTPSLPVPAVSEANPTDTSTSTSNPMGCIQSGSLSTPLYVALYNYKPQKDDELELHKGEQYTVAEKCQDGWFKGTCARTNQAGVFPGNYVHMVRHTSAFKPVSPNVLNIRAKGPSSFVPPAPSTSSTSDQRHVPPVPNSVELPSQAPPLMPRVAKMNTSGQKSRSPSSQLVGGPHRALSTPGTTTVTPSPKHMFPTSPTVPSSSGLSRPLIPAPPPSTIASPHRSLWVPPNLAAMQQTMSASANITPPNVVMAYSLDSPSAALATAGKDKKEKKEKEKKGLVKLLAGKGKKSKQAPPDPEPTPPLAVLCFDNVAHVRSGSYPADSSGSHSVGAGGDASVISAHRKAASFDATTTPPVPAKPRQKPILRERYCCIVPYPPQTEHELALELGDIIHVHRKREDGWYKGTQERTGKTGMFPASFVEKCD